jgi:hypothetical protein
MPSLRGSPVVLLVPFTHSDHIPFPRLILLYIVNDIRKIRQDFFRLIGVPRGQVTCHTVQ